MNWVFIVLLMLFVLLFLLVITKITVSVSYQHDGDNDLLKAKVKVWGVKVYTFSAPLIKIDKDSAAIVMEEDQNIGGIEEEKKVKITINEMLELLKKVKEHLEHIVGLHDIFRGFLKHVHVLKFDWKSNLGVKDASYTGFVTGIAWTLKGSIVGLIGNYMVLKEKPSIMVYPYFQAMISQTQLSCMISFRVGYAIKAGLLIVKHWKGRPTPLKAMKENV